MNELERARLEANLAAKAARMLEEGYTISPEPSVPGLWWVRRPDGAVTYAVYTTQGGHCGCKCYTCNSICHHLLLARQMEETAAWEARIAEYETQQQAAEDAFWGCDPFYDIDLRFAR